MPDVTGSAAHSRAISPAHGCGGEAAAADFGKAREGAVILDEAVHALGAAGGDLDRLARFGERLGIIFGRGKQIRPPSAPAR